MLRLGPTQAAPTELLERLRYQDQGRRIFALSPVGVV